MPSDFVFTGMLAVSYQHVTAFLCIKRTGIRKQQYAGIHRERKQEDSSVKEAKYSCVYSLISANYRKNYIYKH